VSPRVILLEQFPVGSSVILEGITLNWILRDLKLKERGSIGYPCGGGVEYLQRDPASRRKRRKGKPQMRDSKIWSRDPRDSDPRETALAYIKDRPDLSSERAPHKK
jgi:hypothetical protein